MRSLKIDEDLKRWAKERPPRQAEANQVQVLTADGINMKTNLLLNVELQLLYSPEAFDAERTLWRDVIYLNIIQSVISILEVMSEAREVVSPAITSQASLQCESPALSSKHLRLMTSLLPLSHVEMALRHKLVAVGQASKTSFTEASNPHIPSISWYSSNPQKLDLDSPDSNSDNPNVILHTFREDINALWRDPTVKQLLVKEKHFEEKWDGFSNAMEEDILHANLKTDGISKCYLTQKAGSLPRLRVIHDHGRTGGLHWISILAPGDIIIYLVPISKFNMFLEEDHQINCLSHSMDFWRVLVSNKFLMQVEIVLFLNKMDLLKGIYFVSCGKVPT
ncbi:hypothetical protein C0995_014524 [Termitomyces sp. Mi166|nr:hypothetical protein C0995_014524 [Termitomyces sp. Mi166\